MGVGGCCGHGGGGSFKRGGGALSAPWTLAALLQVGHRTRPQTVRAAKRQFPDIVYTEPFRCRHSVEKY